MSDRVGAEVLEQVAACGRAARAATGAMAAAGDAAIRAALDGMAARLGSEAAAVLAANEADMAALDPSVPEALRDRLRLTEARLEAMAGQIATLADAEGVPVLAATRDLGNGLVLEERRRPVGVIGANYEARPNVTVDVASQLVKSRNAGVLRTGAAALGSASCLMDRVVGPALAAAGLPGDAVQLVRTADRAGARALVSLPGLIGLVILRGSGPTTRELSQVAAAQGVRTLAHADGGGVLYLGRAARTEAALAMVEQSLDRLGVCNRLNLLLVDRERYEELVPQAVALLERLRIRASLPPHPHPRGHEWALDDGNEATVTIDAADGPEDAAAIANAETSGLAAGILTDDPEAARAFLDAYAGTGAFWNATTRLLDGFKLLAAPETGINVDHVPGPRGPVTFRDLHLRQFVVRPAVTP